MEIQQEMTTKKLAVLRALRDHPKLRNIEHRGTIAIIARQYRPDLTDVHCDRLCRHIQNSMKLYLPEKEDHRFDKEREYREFFRH